MYHCVACESIPQSPNIQARSLVAVFTVFVSVIVGDHSVLILGHFHFLDFSR
jgi:hypothetical protein